MTIVVQEEVGTSSPATRRPATVERDARTRARKERPMALRWCRRDCRGGCSQVRRVIRWGQATPSPAVTMVWAAGPDVTLAAPSSGIGGMVYDGFISYIHAADDRLAPALQRGLQRLANPWNSRRALRIFRDETGLSTNPDPSVGAGVVAVRSGRRLWCSRCCCRSEMAVGLRSDRSVPTAAWEVLPSPA